MTESSIASPDLIWLLIRKQNAYVHKRRGAGRVFSVERGNLTGIHSPKYSGLANRATLDISTSTSAPGRGVTLSYREADSWPFAVKSGLQTKEVGNGKKGAQREAVQVLEDIGRPEVYQAALKRTKAVLASQNPNRPAAQRKRTARPVQHGDDE